MLASRVQTRLGAPVARSRQSAVVCRAQKQDDSLGKRLGAGAMAAALTLALMGSAPDVAEAAKSSGRVGGSSGFKSRRMEPSRRSNTTINNTTVVAPSPMYAPPVYSPFGFGGFSIMPTFVVPIGGFGFIFQFFFLIMVLGVVFNVIRGLAAAASQGGNNNNNKKDDGWGDL